MSLEICAQREFEIVRAIRAIPGTLAQRELAIAERQLDLPYHKILHLYLAVAGRAHDGLEATKRAIFLAWYAGAEPTVFTGLGAITSEQISDAIRCVDRAIGADRHDAELMAILAHCATVLDALFVELSATSAALLYEMMQTTTDYRRHVRISDDRWERGQMSFYFASMGA